MFLPDEQQETTTVCVCVAIIKHEIISQSRQEITGMSPCMLRGRSLCSACLKEVWFSTMWCEAEVGSLKSINIQ